MLKILDKSKEKKLSCDKPDIGLNKRAWLAEDSSMASFKFPSMTRVKFYDWYIDDDKVQINLINFY